MLKMSIFYILGLCFNTACFVLTQFFLSLIYSPTRGDNFIIVIVVFIVLAIAVPTIAAVFFWKKNRPFALGIATAPIAVPMLALIFLMLLRCLIPFDLSGFN